MSFGECIPWVDFRSAPSLETVQPAAVDAQKWVALPCLAPILEALVARKSQNFPNSLTSSILNCQVYLEKSMFQSSCKKFNSPEFSSSISATDFIHASTGGSISLGLLLYGVEVPAISTCTLRSTNIAPQKSTFLLRRPVQGAMFVPRRASVYD